MQALPQVPVPKPDAKGDVATDSHADVERDQALLQEGRQLQTYGNMLDENCGAYMGFVHHSHT